jgi:VWFA-related protein
MSRFRHVCALLIAAFLVGNTSPTGAAPQEPAQPAPQPQGDGAPAQPLPTFRGSIDFVRVDIFVSDRDGRPVTDLKESEFEIVEDGKPQKVEQFRVINIGGPGAPPDEPVRQIRTVLDAEVEAQRDDVRLFVIFLDDYHVRDRNAVAARSHLTSFIDTQLRPTDMLGVMYPLTPVNDVIFTRDHQSVARAIQNFQGVKYDYRPRNAFEREYERLPTTEIEKIRNQVVTSALEGLSMRLGGMRDGRKSVIFVSEGFTTWLPPQMRRQNAQAPQLPLATVTDPRVEDAAEIQGQMELESRIRDVYKMAVRNNTVFYPLDPRGLAVFEFDISDGGGAGIPNPDSDTRMLRSTQDSLRNLAGETGGRAIINRNTLAEGLAEMMRDSSFYYLIGYTTQAPADGKFHEIRVRVKRPGVSVRARKGYWAYTPEDIKRFTAPRAPEVAKPIQQALADLSAPVQAARYVRTWIGTERGDNGRTRVTLVWEPLPIQAGVRREQAGVVALSAVDGQGALVYRGRSPDAPAASSGFQPIAPAGNAGRGAAAAPVQPTGPQRITFEAPPGKLEMRLQIDAATGGRLDDETRSLQIPDLTSPDVKLSTPRVFRARTARDFQAAAGSATAVPAASREFSRAERLLIRFDAYAPGSETGNPVAAMLSRTGQKMGDVAVSAAAVGGTHQIDLPLNTMAAGEYVLEISLTGADGTKATELVAFRVGA